jgi:hypothetical protein
VTRSVPLEERSGVGATCLRQGVSGVTKLSYYSILFIVRLFTPLFPLPVFVLEEDLVLYMHLRIFVYTSNTLKVSFE